MGKVNSKEGQFSYASGRFSHEFSFTRVVDGRCHPVQFIV